MRQEQEDNGEENGQFSNTNEIAEILRVHQRTVQRWISCNHLKAIKVGLKILRISTQDLDEFLKSQNKNNYEEAES